MISITEEEARLERLDALRNDAHDLAMRVEQQFGHGPTHDLRNRGNYIGATADLLAGMLKREAKDQADRLLRYHKQDACPHERKFENVTVRCRDCHTERIVAPGEPDYPGTVLVADLPPSASGRAYPQVSFTVMEGLPADACGPGCTVLRDQVNTIGVYEALSVFPPDDSEE